MGDMRVRSGRPADYEAIQEIARGSFQTSYALSPAQIDTLVSHVFSAESLEDWINDPDVEIRVVENDELILGFAVLDIAQEGTVHWLHVDPDARGSGVGTQLMEDARTTLSDHGFALQVRVLEDATEGKSFLERFGLTHTESAQIEYAGETFYEQVYTIGDRANDANQPVVDVPPYIEIDDRRLRIEKDEIPGSDAPFYPISSDDESNDQWGYFCSNCGSVDVSANGLDRLECGNCGNRHLADEWDAAYL